MIYCLFSGDIYLSFGVSNSFSFVFKAFCEDLFETLVILSAMLLLIKSPVASAIF